MIALLAALVLQAQASALRIVVIEGEGAVNIIQQKTAVRPLVEIRDRNNLPIAGATVTFTIGGGSPAAFAGGVQTLTVTTNAAGQAAAGGLNALSSGAFQIQVQAAYQGQIASAAISQTNFATAAAASQAGAATGAGGGTGGSTGGAGGGAAGGGGISGTTIGIVGAAVAGGAVAATQVAGGEGGGRGGSGSERRFTGPLTGQIVRTTITSSQSGATTCVSTRTVNATLTITLRDGNAAGRLETSGTQQEVSVSGGSCSPLANPTVPFVWNGEVTGGPANLTFTAESTASSTSGATVTVVVTVKFSGSLSGDTITGTFGYAEVSNGTNVFNGVSSTIQGGAQANFPVTLR